MIHSVLVIATIVATINAMVVAHELGHYVAGRIFGVKMVRFGIGFWQLFAVRWNGGIPISIGLIPFGGFVEFLSSSWDKDSEGNDVEPGDPALLENKSAWVRLVIYSAGPAVSILLPIAMGAAFVVGLYIAGPAGSGARALDALLGVSDAMVDAHVDFFLHPTTESLGGPVSIGHVMYDAIDKYGFVSAVPMFAMFSAGIGIMNLVPFPGLDGAAMVAALWEIVSGKRVPRALAKVASAVGGLTLLGLVAYLSLRDIWRLW